MREGSSLLLENSSGLGRGKLKPSSLLLNFYRCSFSSLLLISVSTAAPSTITPPTQGV